MPRGGTMRASCQSTGMYPCLPNLHLGPDVWHIWVFSYFFNCFCFFTNHLSSLVLSLSWSILHSSSWYPLWSWFTCLFFALHLPRFWVGGVFCLCSACSVFGVVMQLMRTRFPLLPGSLTWRRCIPAALQSRYNYDSWCLYLVFLSHSLLDFWFKKNYFCCCWTILYTSLIRLIMYPP